MTIMMNYYEPLLTKRYHIQSLFSLVAPSRHRHHGPGTIAPGSSSGLEIPWLHSGGVACLNFHAENLAENPLTELIDFGNKKTWCFDAENPRFNFVTYVICTTSGFRSLDLYTLFVLSVGT